MKPDLSHLGDERIFIDPRAYAELDSWHAAAERLRESDPLPSVKVDGFVPFRAVTRHADVAEVERNHDAFHNTISPVLLPIADNERRRALFDVKTLVQMDGREHREYRKVTHDWFKPANLRRTVEAGLRPLARRFVDRMVELGGECDFAADIALYYPLRVIMQILGVPEADEPKMLHLTQRVFSSQDTDFAGDEEHGQAMLAALMDIGLYFQAVTEDRRRLPTNDVASTIANAKIDERPIPDLETAGYYAIVATAGHDTTSSSLAGGLEALIRHPDQLRALGADPSLLPNAVDEIIRWVTPVRHFMRQARRDVSLGGQRIAAGDWLLLSYLSANRDRTVFAEPYRFDILRPEADQHLAFGIGVHFCLGAHLARMELIAFLEELLPRLEHIELAGDPAYTAATFVGGPKRLPIRYRLRPAAA